MQCASRSDMAWEWEEGAAEAVSTFRVAADFCEQYERFVFNHNEVILYQWVEEYEPELFKRIQRLVKAGKWHIMGGWYLQPDCNMPSGESFVRQALAGRTYFKEKFGVCPTTAINFDPFGHTRGLVQILKKCGYDAYIFCRPEQKDCPLPADDFVWVGYDGSRITAHRAFASYLSLRGQARKKIEGWLEAHPASETGLVLWGIGNHGGGPSRIDLEAIHDLKASCEGFDIRHSIPEAYFAELSGKTLPEHTGDLNPWAVGCYTSQIRIKQKHRQLENQLYMTEKMISSLAVQDLMVYPEKALKEALQDLLTAQFHDILPGSSIQPVEEASIRMMDHGLEILSRLKTRAFFALASGQEKAAEGDIPILIYNPHPFKVKGVFECEFQLPDQNWGEDYSMPVVYQNGLQLPAQVEKEESNLNLDWRKRTVLYAELEPSQMNRFDCRIERLPEKPKPQLDVFNDKIFFKTSDMEIEINAKTGLMDSCQISGIEYLAGNGFQPMVMEDNEDPWGSRVQTFPEAAGNFSLLATDEGSLFSGIKASPLASLRVIEDGEVRTVVEAVFGYHHSFICQRYKLPKQGSEIEIETRVHWNEKDKMLKLSIPTPFHHGSYIGQTAFGIETFPTDGREVAAQKWTAAVSKEDALALTCINDGIYGSDFQRGEIRLSLLRSSAYSSLPIQDRPLMPQDRYSPRIDQGERIYRFWIHGGEKKDRLTKVDREALCHNEKPFSLSFFPSGEREKPLPGLYLRDDAVQLTAFKKAEQSGDYIIRLYEPAGHPRTTTLHLPWAGFETSIPLMPFEVKTFRWEAAQQKLTEVSMTE